MVKYGMFIIALLVVLCELYNLSQEGLLRAEEEDVRSRNTYLRTSIKTQPLFSHCCTEIQYDSNWITSAARLTLLQG